jgi:hypothetical protein
MFDVLDGLPAGWFDHMFNSAATRFGFGTNADGGKNVRYPLLDLGYFINTELRIGYFDLRACFSVWTMCLAIARKVNKTLTFSGGLPARLFNTFITPKDWKYSDRLIETNSITLTLASNPQVTGSINAPQYASPATLLAWIYPTQTKTGIFNEVTTRTVSPPLTTTTLVNSSYYFGTNFEFAICFKFEVSNLRYRTVDTDFQQRIEFRLDCIVKNGNVADFEYSFLPDWNCGYSSAFPLGREPNFRIEGNKVILGGFANQIGVSPKGDNVYATMVVRFKGSKVLPDGDDLIFTINETEWGVAYPTGSPLVQPQGQVNITYDYFSPIAENYIKVSNNERIFGRGLISGADLMASLKPADVLRYAMRLTGSYLVETETTLTLAPFTNYLSNTPTNWSGKANLINGITVDYFNNNLGKNNYLIYKQDDTNTELNPYFLAGNLPTGIGTVDNILYESVFAQSAINQTFKGLVALVRVPYYDAPLAYFYRVWVNDATAYIKGQSGMQMSAQTRNPAAAFSVTVWPGRASAGAVSVIGSSCSPS